MAGSASVARAQGARRRRVRLGAAVLSTGCGVVYFAIALGLVRPVESAADAQALRAIGFVIGGAFAIGTLLLLGTDRQRTWIVGSALQVVLIVLYVANAGNRIPAFEPWGVLLGIAQAMVLLALAYLVASAGGRCECAYCRHHRRVHRGRCLVVGCPCDLFL